MSLESQENIDDEDISDFESAAWPDEQSHGYQELSENTSVSSSAPLNRDNNAAPGESGWAPNSFESASSIILRMKELLSPNSLEALNTVILMSAVLLFDTYI